MRPNRDAGALLLGSWLMLTGLLPLTGVNLQGGDTILALLAIASGALIIWGR